MTASLVTPSTISNNAEIDVIWEEFQAKPEPLRTEPNAALGKKWEEWEIRVMRILSDKAKKAHAAWCCASRVRRRSTIHRQGGCRLLYDRPYEDKSRVRVAGRSRSAFRLTASCPPLTPN